MAEQRYRTIVADPPWPYPSPGKFALGETPLFGSAGSRERYGAMTITAICDLSPPAADDAHLYLWTTNAFMVEAHTVARAWGFEPKTICTWGKVKPTGEPSMKSGYYFRGATEHVVFAVRGSLPFPDDQPTPTLWLWPRLPHSVKPDAFYDLVERVSPGPYLELFARRARFGWSYWGDESLTSLASWVESSDDLPRDLADPGSTGFIQGEGDLGRRRSEGFSVPNESEHGIESQRGATCQRSDLGRGHHSSDRITSGDLMRAAQAQCHAATRISHAEEAQAEAWCVKETGHPGAHLYAFCLNSELEAPFAAVHDRGAAL